MKYLHVLLIFVPIAILAGLLRLDPVIVFFASSLAMIPLAGLLGEATEELAEATGPKVGGFLNATFGNAVELIITIAALRAGKYTLVKASITGSILGNILMVLGFSMLLGGLRNGLLKYDRTLAGVHSTMMILAVIGLIVPTVFVSSHKAENLGRDLTSASIGVAGILLFMYALALVFTFSKNPFDADSRDPPTPGAGKAETGGGAEEVESSPRGGRGVAIPVTVLAISAALVVVLSELLVGAVEPVVRQCGISEFFIGIILVPIVGNVAEHIVGVQMALKNRMDLSLSIAFGSSMQIALFVAPVAVLLSLFVGPAPMDLCFHAFEVIALALGVLIAALISLDGESHWLEGAQLLAVYAIFGVAFFYMK